MYHKSTITPGLSRKLAAPWISPYEVTTKICPVVYHLNLQPELVIQDVFHASPLKTNHGLVPSCPAPIVVADINMVEYIFEALLYHCRYKYNHAMKTKYLVK